MKKQIYLLLLGLCITHAFGMHHKKPAGPADEQNEQYARAAKKRKTVSDSKKSALATDLLRASHSYPFDLSFVHHLLDEGADPDGSMYGSPLEEALEMKNSTMASLLLAYGANPQRLSNYTHTHIAPITLAQDHDSMRALLNMGANINDTHYRAGMQQTVLHNLCRKDSVDLFAVVWALKHGANPNIIGSAGEWAGAVDIVEYPLHRAVEKRDLALTIALLQYGAQLNLENSEHHDVLTAAHKIFSESEQDQSICVIYQIIKAISEKQLNPSYIYTTDEYDAMGIPYGSAKLIQKATLQVNETLAQCNLDDWQFEHPGQSLSKFILERELGQAGHHRK